MIWGRDCSLVARLQNQHTNKKKRTQNICSDQEFDCLFDCFVCKLDEMKLVSMCIVEYFFFLFPFMKIKHKTEYTQNIEMIAHWLQESERVKKKIDRTGQLRHFEWKYNIWKCTIRNGGLHHTFKVYCCTCWSTWKKNTKSRKENIIHCNIKFDYKVFCFFSLWLSLYTLFLQRHIRFSSAIQVIFSHFFASRNSVIKIEQFKQTEASGCREFENKNNLIMNIRSWQLHSRSSRSYEAPLKWRPCSNRIMLFFLFLFILVKLLLLHVVCESKWFQSVKSDSNWC